MPVLVHQGLLLVMFMELRQFLVVFLVVFLVHQVLPLVVFPVFWFFMVMIHRLLFLSVFLVVFLFPGIVLGHIPICHQCRWRPERW